MKKSRAPRGSFAPADAIALVAAALAAFFLLVVMVRQAHAHDWFSRKVDPVFGWRCCGGNDCKVIRPNGRNITAEKDGYRIRLSLEEARAINPVAELPVDGLVLGILLDGPALGRVVRRVNVGPLTHREPPVDPRSHSGSRHQ